MKLELADLLQWAGGASGILGGWLWKELRSLRGENSTLHAGLAQHRTHVAEKYVTKDDLNTNLNRVYDALERIEQKLDQRT